jgi:hypothetical protein
MGRQNMKFKIVYDKNNILRVRAGRNAFTEKQGYGIARLLTSKKRNQNC